MAKVMTIRPPEELHKQLKYIAKGRGYTMNQLVLQILHGWLKHENKKQ
ncbi:MAG TPA: hypothetical protein DHW78_03640 [Ruminococcaceae bacterium]|jgi:predicted HicB family RNase H-like nuclease|nr:hypothetical protein [Oscillospiraceae bacterium]